MATVVTKVNYDELCEVVKTLRLLTNTEKEWGRKYGKLDKQGKRDVLFKVLYYDCQYDYEIDLKDLLFDYQVSMSVNDSIVHSKSDMDNPNKQFVTRNKRSVILTNQDKLLSLIRYGLFPEWMDVPSELKKYKDIENYLGCNPALLLLWFIKNEENRKLIPYYNEKIGDIKLKTSDYVFFAQKLRELLSKLYPTDAIFKEDPLIKTEFDKIKKNTLTKV